MTLREREVERQLRDWVETGGGDASELADHLGARRWAFNEVGAAIAHQIVEPLTALRLYIHEMKRISDAAPGDKEQPAVSIVDQALREIERACAIMERIGTSFDGPHDGGLAVARGREAIGWLKRSSADPVRLEEPTKCQTLTAREREVLALISAGSSNKLGAAELRISPRTFEAHRAHVMRKLGARNLADLIRIAFSEA
jgi:DNA-binding CsgD family transcriptional regulator